MYIYLYLYLYLYVTTFLENASLGFKFLYLNKITFLLKFNLASTY